MMDSTLFDSQLLESRRFLMGFAVRLTNDQIRAEDLCQETILKALSYKARYTDEKNFKGWIGTIMKNTFSTNFRRSHRIGCTIVYDKDAFAIAANTYITYNTIESELASRDLLKLVHILPDGLRTTFKMRLEGASYLEITKATGVPIGTVKSRIFLSRKFLINKLKHQK